MFNYAFHTSKRDINVSKLKPTLERKYEEILKSRKMIIDNVDIEEKDLER